MIDFEVLDSAVDYKAEYSSLLAGVKVVDNHLEGICPWHEDTSYSLRITLSSGLFFCKCQNCKKTGNLITLMKKVRGMTAKEAEKELRKKYGLLEFTPIDSIDQSILPSLPEWLSMPSGYRLCRGGIIGPKGVVCLTPMYISRLIRSTAGLYRAELAMYIDGEWTYQSFDLASLLKAGSLVDSVSRYGALITSSIASRVVDYLAALKAANASRIPISSVCEATGWIDDDNFIPFHANGFELSSEDGRADIANALKTSGTLNDWVDAIGKYRKNRIFQFILSASFAAPLLHILDVRSFFVYNWCSSGSGKTAAVHAALSVWGRPSPLVLTYNATLTGLERKAQIMCDLPMAIDERQCVGRQSSAQDTLEALVYMLSNETGKTRGGKSGGLQATAAWKTIVLSTGEQPLVDAASMDGVVNRCITLTSRPFDATDDCGSLYKITNKVYGVAGEKFIDIVATLGFDKIISMHQEAQAYLESETAVKNGTHITSIAACMVADQIAGQVIFGKTADDAKADAYSMGVAIAKENSVFSNRDVNLEALSAIKDALFSEAPRFLEEPDQGSYSDLCYGFFSKSKDEVCWIKIALKNYLTKRGFNYDKTIRYMAEHGLLVHENNRYDIKRTCKSIFDRSIRVICVRYDELMKYGESDESKTDSIVTEASNESASEPEAKCEDTIFADTSHDDLNPIPAEYDPSWGPVDNPEEYDPDFF